MAVVTCGVVFLCAVAAVAAVRGRTGVGGTVREAVLVAAALWGGLVVALTETLGAFEQLRFHPVLECWVGVALGVGVLAWMNRRSLAGRRFRVAPLDWADCALLATTAAVVLASGIIAVRCPPNNYDVTLYHLPRQLQWLQQGSVAHFPTQDYRLTVNPPFAEFVGLHLQLLSGTDRLATVESWGAMVLSLLAVSLVARELGLGRKGQLFAALFAATIPVGFHEAVNGKNDWVVAFWLAASTFWVLRAWTVGCVRFAEAVCAGLSIGLLALTKGTGGLYAVPLVLLGGLALAWRRPAGWPSALVLVAAFATLPNLGHWSRNLTVYGSVSGQTFGLGNERQGPDVWASGLIRNVGMHLAGPKGSWNQAVDRYVHRVHDWLGLAAEDPQTTWHSSPFQVAYQLHREDFATAPVHTLLLLGAVPAALVSAIGSCGSRPFSKGRSDREALGNRHTGPPNGHVFPPPMAVPWLVYLLTTVGGFLLFCTVFKWQPWHPRLHLPTLAMGGIAVGWLVTRPVIRWAAPVAVAGLVLSIVPAATRSEARSLGSHGLNVFRNDPDSLRFLGQSAARQGVGELVSRVLARHPRAVDLINNRPAPWEYAIALGLRAGSDPPWVGYFYPVAGSPPARRPADVVIDAGGERPPALVRHPRTRTVYAIADRVGEFTIYSPVRPGEEWQNSGYRLGQDGKWEAIPGRTVGPPPPCDHPVARFGIGAEQPDCR